MVTQSKQKQPGGPSEDVEMRSADSPSTPDAGGDGKTVVDVDAVTLEDFKEQAKHIEKFVVAKEPRFMMRVLRSLGSTRKKLNAKVLRKLINGFYTHSPQQKESLLAFIDEPMETDSTTAPTFKARTGKAALQPLLPELDAYFHMLVLIYLIDLARYQLVIIQFNCCLNN